MAKKLVRYDAALALAICERIATGATLTAICQEPGMPNRATFWRWLIANEELRSAYDAARELQSHALFDGALAQADRLRDDKLDRDKVNALRVAIDTYKWAAGRLNPKEYGERVTSGPAIAVVINTPLGLGSQGRERGPVGGENLYSLSASIETVDGGSTGTDAEPRLLPPADARPRSRRSGPEDRT